MRDIIRYLDDKEKEEIRPLARTVAHDFSTSELEDVETKIRRRTTDLERRYPDKDAIPSGKADLLASPDWDPASKASRSARWQIRTEVKTLRDLQGK